PASVCLVAIPNIITFIACLLVLVGASGRRSTRRRIDNRDADSLRAIERGCEPTSSSFAPRGAAMRITSRRGIGKQLDRGSISREAPPLRPDTAGQPPPQRPPPAAASPRQARAPTPPNPSAPAAARPTTQTRRPRPDDPDPTTLARRPRRGDPDPTT